MELLTKSSSYSESLSYTDIPTEFLLRRYSGRYRNGKAVYFYNESDNRRIYCGRFWFRRKKPIAAPRQDS